MQQHTMTPTPKQLELLAILPQPFAEIDMRVGRALLSRGWAVREGDAMVRTRAGGDALLRHAPTPPPDAVRLLILDTDTGKMRLFRAFLMSEGYGDGNAVRRIMDRYEDGRTILIERFTGPQKPGTRKRGTHA